MAVQTPLPQLKTLFVVSYSSLPRTIMSRMWPSRANPGERPGCLGFPKRTMAGLAWDQQFPRSIRWEKNTQKNYFGKVNYEMFSCSVFSQFGQCQGAGSLSSFPAGKKMSKIYLFFLIAKISCFFIAEIMRDFRWVSERSARCEMGWPQCFCQMCA